MLGYKSETDMGILKTNKTPSTREGGIRINPALRSGNWQRKMENSGRIVFFWSPTLLCISFVKPCHRQIFYTKTCQQSIPTHKNRHGQKRVFEQGKGQGWMETQTVLPNTQKCDCFYENWSKKNTCFNVFHDSLQVVAFHGFWEALFTRQLNAT